MRVGYWTLIVMLGASCHADPPGGNQVPETPDFQEEQEQQETGTGGETPPSEPTEKAAPPEVFIDGFENPTKWEALDIYGQGPKNGYVMWGNEDIGFRRIPENGHLGSDGVFCVMVPTFQGEKKGDEVKYTFTPYNAAGEPGPPEPLVLRQQGVTPPTEEYEEPEPPIVNMVANQEVDDKDWTLLEGSWNSVTDEDHGTGWKAKFAYATWSASLPQIHIPLKEFSRITSIKAVFPDTCPNKTIKVWASDLESPNWIHRSRDDWDVIWHFKQDYPEGPFNGYWPTHRKLEKEFRIDSGPEARWIAIHLRPCEGGTFRGSDREAINEIEVMGYPVTWRPPPAGPPPEDPPECK